MRYKDINEGEVIPFPNRRQAAPNKPVAVKPPDEPQPAKPDYPSFIRISNPRGTPGQRGLDIVWTPHILRLTPMQARAILHVSDSLRIDVSDGSRARFLITTRRGDDLWFHWEYELRGKMRDSRQFAVPFADFEKKAKALLASPRSKVTWPSPPSQ